MSLDPSLISIVKELIENLDSLHKMDRSSLNCVDDSDFKEALKVLQTNLSVLKLAVEDLQSDVLSDNCQIFHLVIELMREEVYVLKECGFFLCEFLFKRFGKFIVDNEVSREHADTMSIIIGLGLTHSGSDVRLSAGRAARTLLLSLVDTDHQERYFPQLLPKLCVSRHYIEQSRFLLYSLETWSLVTQNEGRSLVTKYIEKVVEYHEIAAKSELKGVRQAVCNCIGELGRKIEPRILQSYIPRILSILQDLFNDPQSIVRESSCNACKDLFENHPLESPLFTGKFFQCSIGLIGDSDFRVRISSSQLISLIVLKNGMLDEALTILEEGLKEIKNQSVDKSTIKSQGKCSQDELCQKKSMSKINSNEPWMRSDGCFRLISEMSSDGDFQKEIIKLIPLMIEATKPKDYADHYILIETFLSILPIIGRKVVKRQFKELLSYFFEIIFYAIESNIGPTMSAGKECLQHLSVLLGPSILKGRIEQFNPRFLVHLN